MENCHVNAPRHLQLLMINWLHFGGRGGGDQEACAKMRALMQSNLKGAMGPAFQSLRAAAAAVGGSVNYLRAALDGDAGQCLDFDSDPFVVTLIPEPMDYFRACGAT
eukprot:564289-Rhodomonas_salina.1